ncbi:MAG TPA: DUF11 domain-containing protein, partial [Gaiellaceae bacterium]|nr:DUF11 domain-containing protein [Gaiellaceae bacterium]
LGTLAANGGPTKTLALQPGSPAIDAGDGGACPATDQRGVARSGVCDIGAYEFVPPPPPVPAPSPTPTTTAGPAADVAVTGSFTPPSATASTPVTLDLVVANKGPSDAHSVIVTLALPPGLTVASGPSGCAPSTTGQTCIIGTLADGGLTSLAFSLTSPADASEATVTAGVSADESDPVGTNNTTTVTLASGCATQLALDAVTVLADCITGQADGTLLATGNVRFSQGATIDLAGTTTAAPLVIDPAAHTMALQPGVTGTLVAGGRAVATGNLVVHTQPRADPNSSLSGEPVDGVQHVDVALSGWTFLDDLASTGGLYLLPGGEDGGALVVGELKLPPWTLTQYSATLSVQVSATGKRAIRSAEGMELPAIEIPHTDWKLADVKLQFLDGGDVFTGTASFKTSVLDKIQLGPVTINHGKLQTFYIHYDGTGCSSCSVTDPTIGNGNITIADLRYVSALGENLLKIPYTSIIGPPCAVTSLTTGGNCDPPQIRGEVEAGFYGNRITALIQFQYLLSGELHATGRVFFTPILPASFTPPSWASGASSFVSLAKKGIEIDTAHLDYVPPHHYDIGGTFQVVGNFLVGNASIGFDPPHFTGEAGLTLQIPPEAPVLGGHKIGDADALISDKAAAAEADIKVCLFGLCAKTFVAAAYEWDGHWVFQEPVEDFRTVSASDGERLPADSARGPLSIPAGWKLAAVQVASSTSVPDVRLTSPDGRIAVSRATSSELGNQTGALVSTSETLHQELFLLAYPEGGRWQVDRLDGPAITSVMVGRGLEPPAIRTDARDLPTHAATGGSIRLHWRTANPWPGATVDLWAGQNRDGAGGTLIATGLPASGSTTWKLAGLQSGRYHVWAILNRDGIPGRSAYWPGSTIVVNASAPPPPAHVTLHRSHGLVVASWPAVRRARVYAVLATPTAGKPVEVDTPRTRAVLKLLRGHGYVVTVQSIGANEFRGAPSHGVRIRG